jgi:SAM-dependent methyltransferase
MRPSERVKRRILATPGLYPFVRRYVLLREVLKTRAENARFSREHPGVRMPPLSLMADAQGHTSFPKYWASGQKDAAQLRDLFMRFYEPRPGQPPVLIFEWGCGPGRLIRHLSADPPFADSRLIGSDFNTDSVAWCRWHLPGIDFVVNKAEPPLPLPDGTVDILYARSVLTHLPDHLTRAWMKELRRVVRPGGLIVLSTGGANFRNRFDEEANARFDRGEPVYLERDRAGKRDFFAWHPPSYVRKAFLAGLEEIAFLDSAENPAQNQDIWVCRVG